MLACDRQLLTLQDPFAVSLEQAQQVAEHLASSYVPTQATPMKMVASHFTLLAERRPALYVFNYQGGGFSIIAADRHLMPVLAYSATGFYTNADKPGGLLLWERKTSQLVADAHALTTPSSATILAEWEVATAGVVCEPEEARNQPAAASRADSAPVPVVTSGRCGSPEDYAYTTTLGPLVPVTWGQGCTYNNLCPTGSLACGHRYTGCIMTAMAQIMAYWRYPTTYDWVNMPTDQGNSEVQRLMVDIGSSIPSTDYYASTGTEADLEEAAGLGAGFYNYRFRYSSADYVGYDYQVVKNQLDRRQPVVLDGCNSIDTFGGVTYRYNDCHSWVCDGYQETTYKGTTYLLFHMNWGWHETYTSAGAPSNGIGDYNGWYQFNNWYIQGRNLNFQYANSAVVNIHP